MNRKLFKTVLSVLVPGIILGVLLILLEESYVAINLTPPVLITIFSIVFIIVFIYLALKEYSRQRHLVSILNEQVDTDLFLKEIQLDIDKVRNKNHKRLFLVNKSAGLIFKGEFHEAVRLLESINPNKLNNKFRVLYFNNIITALLEIGRLDDAFIIWNRNFDIFSMNTKHKTLNTAIRSTKATLDFYQGKISESKNQFSELLQGRLHNSARAVVLFYLGQINLKEGNTDLGVSRLKEAAELGRKTYIPKRVAEFI